MFGHVLPKGSLRRIIAGNTLSQLTGRIVSTVIVVFVSLLIARRFGPAGYGDFVKITTYVGFFYLFADFGLNAVFIQRSVTSTDVPRAIALSWWQTLLGLRIVISTMLMVAAVFLLALFPQGFGQGYTSLVRFGIFLLAPVIIAQAITTTTNAWFQKMLRYDLATIAQVSGSIAMLLLAVSLSLFTSVNGPMLGVVAVMAGGLVTSLVALMLVHKETRTVVPLFGKRDFFSFLQSGAPLGFALVFNLIYFHADSVILTLYRSTQEVGIYGLAYKVFELPLVLPIFFMNAVYPVLLRSQQEGRDAEQRVFAKSLVFLGLSSLFIFLVLWFVAPYMAFVRPDFNASIAPLRILLLGLPIFFVSALYMWVIIAQKQQGVLLIIHGGAMAINILSNLLFVPRHGSIAAAWITVFSEALVLIASILFVSVFKRKLKGESIGIM